MKFKTNPVLQEFDSQWRRGGGSSKKLLKFSRKTTHLHNVNRNFKPGIMVHLFAGIFYLIRKTILTVKLPFLFTDRNWGLQMANKLPKVLTANQGTFQHWAMGDPD